MVAGDARLQLQAIAQHENGVTGLQGVAVPKKPPPRKALKGTRVAAVSNDGADDPNSKN